MRNGVQAPHSRNTKTTAFPIIVEWRGLSRRLIATGLVPVNHRTRQAQYRHYISFVEGCLVGFQFGGNGHSTPYWEAIDEANLD
jgi:hypothetical protein